MARPARALAAPVMLYAIWRRGGVAACACSGYAPQPSYVPWHLRSMPASSSAARSYARCASVLRPVMDTASARPRRASALRGSIPIAARCEGTASSGRPALESEPARPRGRPRRCADRSRLPRGARGLPPRAVLHSRASRPGRGGPRRCTGRARRPGGTRGRTSGPARVREGSARPRLARAYGRRLRHHCGTSKPPFQCTRIGGGPVAMRQWRRWRLASLPPLAAKCERHGPPFSASGSTVRHRCCSWHQTSRPAARTRSHASRTRSCRPSLGACGAAAAPLGIRRKAARRTRPCT